MEADGTFKWSVGDNIFVDKGDEGFVQANNGVTTVDTDATFEMSGTFTKKTYPVLYTGLANSGNNNGKSHTHVTISAVQTQLQPNNSDHFAIDGDCAVAEAQLEESSGDYKFTLNHKASYIVFEPFMNTDPVGNYCKIKKIVIREKNGKKICGNFPFTSGGLDVSDVENGGSEITVICGTDINKGETPDEIDMLKNGENGVPNGFPLYKDKKPDDNRIYMVIAPGKYDLEIEYVTAYYVIQKSEHTENPDYSYDPDKELRYKGWKFVTEENSMVISQEISAEFKENHFKRLAYEINLTDPAENISRRYQFEQYYMWGAKNWFWDGVSSYPTKNDEAQSTDAPDQVLTPDRWHNIANDYNKGVLRDVDPYKYDWTSSIYPSNSVSWTSRDAHKQASSVGGVWANAINANQMSCYVVYGDPYLDMGEKWILESYNGISTICSGGVWLKKKEYIIRDVRAGMYHTGEARSKYYKQELAPGFNYAYTSFNWPGEDNPMWNVDQQSATLPFDENNKVYGFTGDSNVAGRRYNLRYNAPHFNFRTPLKHGKPSDDSKDMNEYFFLPLLGRIEYQNPDHEGVPTMTLVGGQGFYWTRTPLQMNWGNTPYYFGTDYGYDNAFYLNIHYNYIALSWQQRSDYLKTGMRIANTDIFK